MPGPAGRRWPFYFVMVISSLCMALAVCEAGLRLAGVRFSGSFFTSDRTLGWALRPGARGWQTDEGETYVVINSDGQLDHERQPGRQVGQYRVAVLGDSMVEARQVALEETFTARTERLLAGCPPLRGRHVEVLNFGVPGYGTAQEFLQLSTKVRKYQPDLIAVAVYFGNDLFDNYGPLDYTDAGLRPHFVLRDGELVLEPATQPPPSNPWRARIRDLLADVMNASRVLLLLNQARLELTGALSRGSAAMNQAAHQIPGVPSNYAAFWPYLPAESHPQLREAWAITEMAILKIRDEVLSQGADFLLLILPMGRQIHPDPKVREATRREYGVASLDYPDARVAAFAESHGIAILDFTKILAARALRDGVAMDRFPNLRGTGHLNETGHRIVAEALSSYLCDRLAEHTAAIKAHEN
jgi:lysophospholipase L1-like esterase